jgi:hypothetical protein
MVVLRATLKVLKVLPPSGADDEVSDTALGDWYVNRLVVDPQPLLLFVSANSRLVMLAPARDVKSLPVRFAGMVVERLRRLGADQARIDVERAAMNTVCVGRTRDRSVTGQMVDFARLIPYHLPVGAWEASSLSLVEERLGEVPCRAGRAFHEVIFPKQTALRLLKEQWADQ